MGENQIIVLIVVIAVMIGLIYSLVKRPKIILYLVIRAMVGTGIIYVVNHFVAAGVGINLCTIGVSGVLGIPGVILLYAINIYNKLK